jgi:hypothetical protein
MNTVPSSSRLPFGRITNLPSANTFGEVSSLLRNAIADEDSRIFSEGMQDVAMHAEAVVASLRLNRARDAAGPVLMDMLTVLRDHRAQVVNLGLAWRGFYEYAAYLHALNNFRVQIGQWLLQSGPWDDDLEVTAEEFALVAWRTMGEGSLLIDVYEEWSEREANESNLGALQEPQLERVRQWWHRLRR